MTIYQSQDYISYVLWLGGDPAGNLLATVEYLLMTCGWVWIPT